MFTSEMNHDRHTALVVDDDMGVRFAIKHILESNGFDVLTAESGLQAMQMLATALPCIVLTDVRMPEMDGFELCRQIKGTPHLAHLPIVLVTAMISEDDVAEGIQVGAVDYIRKPFDQAEIAMRVRSQVRLHETLIEKERIEKELGLISRTANDAIIVLDQNNLIKHWNEAAESMFGYEKKEALGRALNTLLVPEQHRETVTEAFERHRDENANGATGSTFEITARNKSGVDFPVELSFSSAKIDTQWYSVAIVRDISERKSLQTQLLQVQKLESIGQLAAGIAHEINTPAQYVGDNIAFIKDALTDLLDSAKVLSEVISAMKSHSFTPDFTERVEGIYENADTEYIAEEVPSAIENAREGIDRISKIVRALKEFSHPGVAEKTYADINHCLETTVTVSRNEHKYVAEVTTDLDPALPEVRCHPGDLNQVFLNLIVNAAHAIGAVVGDSGMKGRITISTKKEGDDICIVIADTGTGIPIEIHDRIFDPFFTTKEIGKGTGQGLAIARSIIVDKHNGVLSFETRSGEGTRFIIKLPIDGA